MITPNDGRTLRAYIDAGPLRIGDAVRIARQVADEIEAVRRRDGRIHRDLEPSKILLTSDYQGHQHVKIEGFEPPGGEGETVTDEETPTIETSIETPHYMPPEQCAGKELEPRSNVYSLGVILYEMLAGRPPFDAPSATAIALKHIQEEPRPINEVRADVMAPLAQLLMHSLHKTPGSRPSLGQFARSLRYLEYMTMNAPDDLTSSRFGPGPAGSATVALPSPLPSPSSLSSPSPEHITPPPAAESLPPQSLSADAPPFTAAGADWREEEAEAEAESYAPVESHEQLAPIAGDPAEVAGEEEENFAAPPIVTEAETAAEPPPPVVETTVEVPAVAAAAVEDPIAERTLSAAPPPVVMPPPPVVVPPSAAPSPPPDAGEEIEIPRLTIPVPPDASRAARRSPLVYAMLGIALFTLIGGIIWFARQSAGTPPLSAARDETAAPESTAAPDAPGPQPQPDGANNSRLTSAAPPPNTGPPSSSSPAAEATETAPPTSVTSSPERAAAATTGESGAKAAPTPLSAAAERSAAAALRKNLNAWVAATSARNINAQMSFYMPTLAAFYLTRNAKADVVRREKLRLFGEASAVAIRVGEPQITFSRDGRTATMRFRKQYTITSRGRNRRGEVVQELRWQKTEKGWKIVSERDVQVIR